MSEIGYIKNLQYNAYRTTERDQFKCLVEVSKGKIRDKVLYCVENDDFDYDRSFTERGTFLDQAQVKVIYPDDERFIVNSLYSPFSHDLLELFKEWNRTWGDEFG